MIKCLPGAIALLFIMAGCDSTLMEDEIPVFIVETGGGETFRIKINDPKIEQQADSLLSAGINKIVHGPIIAGDGGFNAPYSWHLNPGEITFPDLAIELCDGRPSFVENDLTYWLESVEVYCPWGAKLVGKEN
ncbi:MAG: hypothetical protein AAF564_05760 [Bacteroidota bacterium]